MIWQQNYWSGLLGKSAAHAALGSAVGLWGRCPRVLESLSSAEIFICFRFSKKHIWYIFLCYSWCSSLNDLSHRWITANQSQDMDSVNSDVRAGRHRLGFGGFFEACSAAGGWALILLPGWLCTSFPRVSASKKVRFRSCATASPAQQGMMAIGGCWLGFKALKCVMDVAQWVSQLCPTANHTQMTAITTICRHIWLL